MSKEHNIGNSPIKLLFLQLSKLDEAPRNRSIPVIDAEYVEAIDRHWRLRWRVAASPIDSLSNLVLVGHALQIEFKRDPICLDDAPGSASERAPALTNGVFRLVGAA